MDLALFGVLTFILLSDCIFAVTDPISTKVSPVIAVPAEAIKTHKFNVTNGNNNRANSNTISKLNKS